MKFDYTMGRRIGSEKDWERIIESEGFAYEDGRMESEPDRFRLEFSGWTGHIEFKPLIDEED